jgi:hypothetical protein
VSRRACMQMDLFFPNETEAMAISGKGSVHEALEELTRDTDALVVITTGPQGAIAKRGRQVWTHAAFDVPSTPPRLHIAHPANPAYTHTHAQSRTPQEPATASRAPSWRSICRTGTSTSPWHWRPPPALWYAPSLTLL